MASRDRALTALHVAVGAGVLLVALVGADAVLNRTVRLEVETDDGWRTLAQIPEDRDSYARPSSAIDVNRSETVRFRVTVDNQRPIGFAEDYAVRGEGTVVAEGRLTADAMGADEAAFTVDGDTLLGPRADGDEAPRPRPVGASLELTVGSDTAYSHVGIQEVAR